LKNIPITIILNTLVFSSIASTALSGDFPKAIKEIEGSVPDKYIIRTNDIPDAVKIAFGNEMPGKIFSMADSGKEWNKTDVVRDPTLPFRRLVWAVKIKEYYVIHYEEGGIVYGAYYMIASLDRKSMKYSVIWAATSPNISKDYPGFIKDLKKGYLEPIKGF
jgi:hypothetical protein